MNLQSFTQNWLNKIAREYKYIVQVSDKSLLEIQLEIEKIVDKVVEIVTKMLRIMMFYDIKCSR